MLDIIISKKGYDPLYTLKKGFKTLGIFLLILLILSGLYFLMTGENNSGLLKDLTYGIIMAGYNMYSNWKKNKHKGKK